MAGSANGRIAALIALGLASLACSDDERPSYLSESNSGSEPNNEPEPDGFEPGEQQPLPADETGMLQGGDCPIDIPLGQNVQCGTLSVPLDYADPDGEQIELAVIVFEGQGDGDPAVYLEGGPGGSGLLSVESLFDYFAPLLAERDLVVLDQRGTGFSSPLLHCVEDQELIGEFTSDEELELALEALAGCAADFRADGIEPARFNTRANAADVDRLRQALGYDQWHVFGVSYGTRLALDVMRYHPEGVASVVLDSVLPPDVKFLEDAASNQEAALSRVFEHCQLQPECAGAYPALETVFYDMVRGLEDQPATIDLGGGETQTFAGTDALELFVMLAYSADAISVMPELIAQISERDLELLSQVLRSLNASEQATPVVALGMYFSVVCAEYVAYITPEALQADLDAVDPTFALGRRATDIFDVCEAWDVPAAPEAERDPVSSDIPTLVLAGSYDPVTPVRWAEQAAATLPNSHFIQFEGAAHAVFASPCAPNLLRDFWETPTANPSSRCPNIDDDLDFDVNPTRLGTATTHFSSLPRPPIDWAKRVRRWFP